MADSENTSRSTIQKMLATIKKFEIENAKTMKLDDKGMVKRISDYILRMAAKEIKDQDSTDEGGDDL